MNGASGAAGAYGLGAWGQGNAGWGPGMYGAVPAG